MGAANSSKFRPYFSAEELSEVISALKESPSPKRLPIIRYLESFNLKINHGLIEPNYISTPRPSLEDKLGFSVSETPAAKKINIVDLHENWLKNPSSLVPTQIADVMDYRYLNNLMTKEEEYAYEQQLIQSSKSFEGPQL